MAMLRIPMTDPAYDLIGGTSDHDVPILHLFQMRLAITMTTVLGSITVTVCPLPTMGLTCCSVCLQGWIPKDYYFGDTGLTGDFDADVRWPELGGRSGSVGLGPGSPMLEEGSPADPAAGVDLPQFCRYVDTYSLWELSCQPSPAVSPGLMRNLRDALFFADVFRSPLQLLEGVGFGS